MKVTGIQSSLAYKKIGAQKRGDSGTSYDNCPP